MAQNQTHPTDSVLPRRVEWPDGKSETIVVSAVASGKRTTTNMPHDLVVQRTWSDTGSGFSARYVLDVESIRAVDIESTSNAGAAVGAHGLLVMDGDGYGDGCTFLAAVWGADGHPVKQRVEHIAGVSIGSMFRGPLFSFRVTQRNGPEPEWRIVVIDHDTPHSNRPPVQEEVAS